MGKKRRIITNPKKFGRKHFDFLDSVDGTKDGVIASSKVPLTIRTLNLVDNGDRTISLDAELFGTGTVDTLRYKILEAGGAAISAVTGLEFVGPHTSSAARSSLQSGQVSYSSSLPALQDASGNPYVFPSGRAKIVAAVDVEGDFPGSIATPTSAAAYLEQEITVGSAPIGLSGATLLTKLNTGADDSGKLSFDTAGFAGTGPQHGSGSGVGSAAVYTTQKAPGGAAHGFTFTVVGSVTGSLKLSDHGGTATTANRHTSDTITLLQSSSVAALASQTLTVTFTPLDVSGAASTADAVSTTVSVPFVVDS